MYPFEKRTNPVQLADTRLGKEELAALSSVLLSGGLREGEQCAAFEKEYADAVGAKYASTMSSGTAALHAAYSYYLSEADEVLVPAMTFFATASMVCWAGAKPVFCDIDPKTFCLDVEDAKKRITPRTKAIAPVHLFGHPAPVDQVLDLAKEFGLDIVWDAAQAHMATYGGRDVGALPGAVCYSFYATKNMTTGEGGMVVTDDPKLRDHVDLLKHQGQEQKYRHVQLGTNYRMTDIAAALGRAQLEKLPTFTQRRRQIAHIYTTGLNALPGVLTPTVAPQVGHAYHQYTILLDPRTAGLDRDEVAAKLRRLNVQVGINYPVPLHQQPVFVQRFGTGQPLSAAEDMAASCLSLPIHPKMSDEAAEYVVSALVHTLEAWR